MLHSISQTSTCRTSSIIEWAIEEEINLSKPSAVKIELQTINSWEQEPMLTHVKIIKWVNIQMDE